MHRERPHPVKACQHALPPLLPRCQDYFGIGLRQEALAFFLQFASQLEKVVDLTVVNDHMASVSGHHGLTPPVSGINDGQAPVPQAQRAVDAEPATDAVRPAMSQQVTEPLNGLIFYSSAAQLDDPGDPTHDSDSIR